MSARVYDTYRSRAMRAAFNTAKMAARSDAAVLLLGETGSGKNYMARFIHDHSHRSGGPFVVVDCTTLPDTLVESELFGYEPSAFTGAYHRKKGRIELAEGGTLVLDEIGEWTITLQSKLLTLVQTKSFYRVGGEKPIKVGARIIAATNRDVVAGIAKGTFRSDLYHRLDAFSIHLPPLRHWKQDIPLLVKQLLETLCSKMKLGSIPQLGFRALKAALSYDWPGNVRELGNVLERCLFLSGGITEEMNALFVEEVRKRATLFSNVSVPPGDHDNSPIIEELLRQTAGKQVRNPTSDQKQRLYRECKVERRCKQKDIAQTLGVSEASVSNWLRDGKAALVKDPIS